MIRNTRCRLTVAAACIAGSLGILLGAPLEQEWKAPLRASRKRNPIQPADTSITVGKELYVQECHSCHGTAGKGDGPAAKDMEKHPGDLSDPQLWSQSDGALFWKLTEGRTPMPAYDKLFSEEQRWHTVNYTRTLAARPAEQKQ